MARPKSETSISQRSLKFISENSFQTRTDVLLSLISEFGVTLAHAKTLYQTWRKVNKTDTGLMAEVFSVRDNKNGLSVDPYMFSKYTVYEIGVGHLSEKLAVDAYVVDLKERKRMALKLK